MRSGPTILAVAVILGTSATLMRGKADDVPKNGTFSVSIQQTGSWQGFLVPNNYWVWIARRKGQFAGIGLLDGMTSTCISKGKTIRAISRAEIHCENTDRDGDKIFEISTEECSCGQNGTGGTGSGNFLGGTGKYVGIRGSFEIKRTVAARDYDAHTWTDEVSIVGRYTLP